MLLTLRCFCHCKGTNFSANHNRPTASYSAIGDVSATAKVLIFQQITTQIWSHWNDFRCFCHCKGTNFSANHNRKNKLLLMWRDVSATAKVLIFQQITTSVCRLCAYYRCFCHCKGTNFSANHNFRTLRLKLWRDVSATAKVLIFQQITTDFVGQFEGNMMFLPLQRY